MLDGDRGRRSDGLVFVRTSGAGPRRQGDRLATAELYRLKGELRSAAAADPASCAQAEDDLAKAIEIARAQGAQLASGGV